MSSCVAPMAWRTKTTILIYPGGWIGQHPKRSSWHNKEKGGLSPPSYSKCYSVFLVLSLYDSTLEVSSCVAPTARRTKTTILIYPGGWVEQRPKRSSWHNKEKGVLSPPPNPKCYSVFLVLSLYDSTRCPPVWPLRPGGPRQQFSSTLEDIQNHVLKGHPGTIRKRGSSVPPSNPAMFIMTSLEALLKHTLHQ